MNVNTIPKLILRIISEESWREWIVPETGVMVKRWKMNTADFREFIEAPRPEGCQTPVHVMERLIRDTPAWEPYLRLTRGKPGAPEGNQNAVKEEGGTNRNNITDCFPATIPLSTDVPRPVRVRNYERESKQGTSVSYTLRRLENNRPDLLDRVKAGEISPNAAAVKAGFRDEAITIPKDPLKASRRLLKHFEGDALITLVTELANHAGLKLTAKV
jgi:hypothetical protein